MREFLDVRVLFEDEDFCSAFCKNCPAVKEIYPKRPEERTKWICTACWWDLRSFNCLRHDAIEEVIEAIDECNIAINKAMELK